jgi:predicted TIM-barrel enzyme
MGYALEVDIIARAARKDMLTTPYVFSTDDAVAMTRAGADIIVCHLGFTTGGSIGAETALTLDDCVARVEEWPAAARAIRDDVIVLCHGGPIAMPLRYRFRPLAGGAVHRVLWRELDGAATTEAAIVAQVDAFRSVPLQNNA